MSDWHIFRESASEPNDDIVAEGRLPDPPPWRDFEERRKRNSRGRTYRADRREVEMVNAALYLRRPLLITGNPGSGKSSLAHAVAWQLNLGPVLWWPINSRSTLQEGLYNYDALGRLRDLNIEKLESEHLGSEASKPKKNVSMQERIGRYIRLGPLGTALCAGDRPRVLLIDEIDKSDIDLPNDLLHVLEEGEFGIPELQRITPSDAGGDAIDFSNHSGDKSTTVEVYPHKGNTPVEMISITGGHVECTRFPLVILTSNGERELPPAFKRRCLSLNIEDPSDKRLRDIVIAHIREAVDQAAVGEVQTEIAVSPTVEELIRTFEEKRRKGLMLATDQLLNAIYLITRKTTATGGELTSVLDRILTELERK